MLSKFSTNRSLFYKFKYFGRNLFFGLVKFVVRFYKSIVLMSRVEKSIALTLLVVVFVLFGFKIKENYFANTGAMPGFGGSYSEVVVGDLKYLNPILATSDTEKSISTLLYSSLFKLDKSGNVIPDVAEKIEISPDQLNYTITLKDGIYFHDGEKLTAADVVYTVQTIQDPGFKSPLYETWKNIEVQETGETSVKFTLLKAYGPFIYNLDFGILPIHLSPDDLAKTMIGSGPYKYEKIKKNGDKITQLNLQSYTDYYSGRPYINNLQLEFFDSKNAALAAFSDGKKYQAISGANTSVNSFSDFSFSTSKKLVLVSNLRVEKFKNKDFRTQILFSDQKLPEKVVITLTTADAELQRNKAEELKKSFSDRNIELDIKYYKPTEMKDILDKKNYELLLFGFDFGHDLDPYIFWHSSQLDKMNYAGYSDKKSDILLEDARMIADNNTRKTKYDQFYEVIKNESLAVYYEPVNYIYKVSDSIKVVEAVGRCDGESKYLGIGKWYIETKRVRK